MEMARLHMFSIRAWHSYGLETAQASLSTGFFCNNYHTKRRSINHLNFLKLVPRFGGG
jgi:hypothetical protein